MGCCASPTLPAETLTQAGQTCNSFSVEFQPHFSSRPACHAINRPDACPQRLGLPHLGQCSSSPSQAALQQVTRAVACRVNAVCPGPILTEGTQRHADSQGVSLEAACQDMIGRMVMPRWVMQTATTSHSVCWDMTGHMIMPGCALETGRDCLFHGFSRQLEYLTGSCLPDYGGTHAKASNSALVGTKPCHRATMRLRWCRLLSRRGGGGSPTGCAVEASRGSTMLLAFF